MRIHAAIVCAVLLAGCAAVPAKNCCEDVFTSQGKAYPASNSTQKNALRSDLRSGKLALGAGVNDVRQAYGEADGVWATACSVRLRYIFPDGSSTVLWFDDGCHLTMWSS